MLGLGAEVGETSAVTVLVGCARSPFAPANGVLGGWHPVDLTAVVLRTALERAGVTGDDIGGLWVGCAEPVGPPAANPARAVALAAGLPDRVGGLVVDRAETSGSAALHAAADALCGGGAEVAVVAGVCMASTVAPGANATGRNYGTPWGDAPAARVRRRGGLLSSPRAAEAAAAATGIDRETLRRWALRSFGLRSAAVSLDAGGGAQKRGPDRSLDAADSTSPGRPVDAARTVDADGRVFAQDSAAPVGSEPVGAVQGDRPGGSDSTGAAVLAVPASAVVAVEARPADGADAQDAARRGSTVDRDVLRQLPEDLSGLPPMFAPDGLLDAVSFAPPADGVTVLVLRRGGPGISELVHSTLAAGDPLEPTGGLTPASFGNPARLGAEGAPAARPIAAVEVAEPSAAGALLVCRALGIEPEARERTVNVRGGTLAVGDAGAAEELRLCVDRMADLGSGELLAAVAAGTGGSAVSVWRRQ